jgi:hypothetical protein
MYYFQQQEEERGVQWCGGRKEDKELAHLLAWWGSPAVAREKRWTVTRKRDEHEELAWKRSAVYRGAVEDSRVFQGIDVGQNAKPVQPNAVLGREGELSHAWS